MQCIRCGQCCIQAPCAHGRVRFHLEGLDPVCPALVFRDTQYACTYIEDTDSMREIMVGTGCLYPQYRKDIVCSDKPINIVPAPTNPPSLVQLRCQGCGSLRMKVHERRTLKSGKVRTHLKCRDCGTSKYV